jgi:hypothetical protein
MKKTNIKTEDTYFWLGDPADPKHNLGPLTEEDFQAKIDAEKEAKRKWLEVEID